LSAAPLTAEELERYARQIGRGVLSRDGQERLKRSSVLVTRAGGMGGPAALCLVMAGVGRVVIAHSGAMTSPDLNRQMLGCEEALGQPRAVHFAQRLQSMNRFITVEAIDHEPDDEEALRLAGRVDLIIASPPTFAERLRLNAAAVAAGIPLVDAAQWGMTGTLIVVQPGQTACLRCLYPDDPPFEEHFPVVGAISSAIGSLAALEAIKLLAGCGEPLAGKMLLIDAYHGVTTQVALQRREDCPTCGRRGA
jgi:molybdopterin/thiamine biosynthesis adenylyltransferase